LNTQNNPVSASITEDPNCTRKLPAGRPRDSFVYWDGATDAGHRHAEPWWIEFYAKELLLYFPANAGRVLECGCGTGVFYPHFKDRCESYLGIDFSESMLREFSLAWPGVQLFCADVAKLNVGEGVLQPGQFDFIFSNQVCQFFDRPKLHRHFESLASLTGPAGSCLIANIPDAQLRLHYYANALRADRSSSWSGALKNIIASAVGHTDGIGYWYSRREMVEIAESFGFECDSFSSASLEYRFHLRLQKT
jgi:SAM-dependent methyltransferase